MIWSVFLLTPYFFCMFFSICFHLCWLAIIASTIVSHTLTAQPARVCKALRVGNKFVYLRVAGKTPLSFYEVVERDTLVREQRYAVIFSSLDGTRRLERSDEFGLYTFDTLTREEKASFWFVQKLRQNDTLRQLAPFGIGSLSTLAAAALRRCKKFERSEKIFWNSAKPQLGEVPKGEPNCGGAVAALERKHEGISL
jgi:hypothetical protein